MSQNFLLGGRGVIVNILQILCCISTGEMYYTYILCSKLSPKHAV